MKSVARKYNVGQFRIQYTIQEILFYMSILLIMGYYTLYGAKIYYDGMRSMLFGGMLFGIGKLTVSIRKIRLITSRKKASLLIVLLLVVMLYRFTLHRDSRILVAAFVMLCGIDVKPEKTIRVMFYVKLCTFLPVLMTGGYHHINGAALHGGMVILLYICMRGDWKTNDLLGVSIPYFFLALYTKSASFMIGIGFAILALYLIRKKSCRKIFASKFVLYSYPIVLILNYLFAITIREKGIPFVGDTLPGILNSMFFKLVRWIDIVTSSRLTLAEVSLEKFGISLWGGNVDYGQIWPGVYFNLDSGMIWLLQGWGLVMTVIFMGMSILLMKFLIGTKRYHYVIAALTIALWATQEDMVVSLGTNFLMVFMGQAVCYCIERNKRRA